ncbi:MAG: LysR substrate-binding domain-containing protein [Parvibaculaceae bacterium]
MGHSAGSARRRLPSLTSIRSFEAVGRHRNFTKAANELAVTQTAVSHQVKSLEESLGLRLFVRTNSGVELTDDGRELLAAAGTALDQLAEVTQRLQQRAARASKEMVVRATPFFSSFWLVPRMERFSRQYPDIEIVLEHSQSPIGDGQQGFSFAISYDDSAPEKFTSTSLFTAPLVPLCTPSMIERAGGKLTVEGLKDEVLINETTYDWWSAWFSLAGAPDISRVRRINIDDPNIAVQVGLSGQGVILGPPKLLREHMQAGRLVAPFDPKFRIDIAYKLFAHPRVPGSLHLSRFQDWLLDELRSSGDADDDGA